MNNNELGFTYGPKIDALQASLDAGKKVSFTDRISAVKNHDDNSKSSSQSRTALSV